MVRFHFVEVKNIIFKLDGINVLGPIQMIQKVFSDQYSVSYSFDVYWYVNLLRLLQVSLTCSVLGRPEHGSSLTSISPELLEPKFCFRPRQITVTVTAKIFLEYFDVF